MALWMKRVADEEGMRVRDDDVRSVKARDVPVRRAVSMAW